ncbi:MAG: hypothetical protein HKN23_08630 [Verrucomicrobiales bacterium]|nr:hypothetical protein [Verrucomicrobiales bacterium]
MKITRFLFGCLFLAGLVLFPGKSAYASPESSTSISAKMTFQTLARARGRQVMSTVVGIVGFNGKDQPQQWMVLAADPKVPNLLHEFALRDGQIVAERHFSRQPDDDLPSIPLPFHRVIVDSNRAFAIAEAAARKTGIGFDVIHYQLRCRDLRNEPVWMLNLVDQFENTVGVMYLSAVTGETLRAVWHRPGTLEYTQANQNPNILNRIGRGLSSAGKSIGDTTKTIAQKATNKPSRQQVQRYQQQRTQSPTQYKPNIVRNSPASSQPRPRPFTPLR